MFFTSNNASDINRGPHKMVCSWLLRVTKLKSYLRMDDVDWILSVAFHTDTDLFKT